MLNQPFAVVPALHSVLLCFTHQVTSGYSISLIRDPGRGTSQCYLRVSWTSEVKQFFLFAFFFYHSKNDESEATEQVFQNYDPLSSLPNFKNLVWSLSE